MQDSFLEEMSKAGISPTHDLILDGNLRRYRVQGDKKGRKNGWYRYQQVSNDFAWGVFGCNKRGVSEKWSNKEPTQITDYERRERRKQERKIKENEEELRGRAAIKANKIWGHLSNADAAHEYLKVKHVKGYGLRQTGISLVIPMFIENYITSLQFIYEDGTKRYLTGGQKEGAYYCIGADSETIYITEGYATGASVHEATGMQAVICFDAGNMPHVAKYVRNKNPSKKIIIAADNDQWTRGNPGISKAQECAKDMGAEIKIPPFSFEDKSHPTDWNDYHRRFGLAALCAELFGLNKVVVTPSVKPEHEWRMDLIEGKQELPGFRAFDGKSLLNGFLFLKNHDKYNGMFAYNEFTDQIIFTRCPPWQNPQRFFPRNTGQGDDFGAAADMEKFGLKMRKGDIMDAFYLVAKENSINPPRDYFERLQWDGKSRLDKWLTYYLGAEAQPAKYLMLVGSKWLIGAVKRVYEPGCKFDSVLILEGPQGIKKTSVFRTLATFHKENCFLEFSGNVGTKDAIMVMQGKIIVELSELASLRKSQAEEMKSFISRQCDDYRPPYGRSVTKRERYFVLAATSNNTKEDGYLVDPTGNRRYWPVECGVIDLAALDRDKEQIWAEAVYRYKAGERVWLEDEEKLFAEVEQSGREESDVWLEPIKDFLFSYSQTSVHQVLVGIGLTAEQKNSKNEKRVVRCLRQLKWKQKGRERTENGRITMWRRSDAQ